MTTLDQEIKNAQRNKPSGVLSTGGQEVTCQYSFVLNQIPRITGFVNVDLITAPTLAVFTLGSLMSSDDMIEVTARRCMMMTVCDGSSGVS
jgi:hypothetical protein